MRQHCNSLARKRSGIATAKKKGRLVLQPVTRAYIENLRGSLKDGPSALKFLLKDRRRGL
jgi:hypothetical protein